MLLIVFSCIFSFLEYFVRSAYFRQIEEDVEKHSMSIMEMKSAIESFKTKDMLELVNFRQDIEKRLECLADETQVTPQHGVDLYLVQGIYLPLLLANKVGISFNAGLG